jgi:hypothetical protein
MGSHFKFVLAIYTLAISLIRMVIGHRHLGHFTKINVVFFVVKLIHGHENHHGVLMGTLIRKHIVKKI